ncbi:hypothetical protein COLO4_00973 [Corchorus olitorius]|uniref:Uncharacterized protein n=1 Tax=Corchorus olitorius TaxID=93759 RepID=A0A1R3L355_9ROSI|nr:hypothetical protein COLO4_00973 [Corchorus olitorius]
MTSVASQNWATSFSEKWSAIWAGAGPTDLSAGLAESSFGWASASEAARAAAAATHAWAMREGLSIGIGDLRSSGLTASVTHCFRPRAPKRGCAPAHVRAAAQRQSRCKRPHPAARIAGPMCYRRRHEKFTNSGYARRRHQRHGPVGRARGHHQRGAGRLVQRLHPALQRAARGGDCGGRVAGAGGIVGGVHREGVGYSTALRDRQGRRAGPDAHAPASDAAPGRCAVAASRDWRGRGARRIGRCRARCGRRRHAAVRHVQLPAPVSGVGRGNSERHWRGRLRVRHERRVLVGHVRAGAGHQRRAQRHGARRAGSEPGNHLRPPRLERPRLPLHLWRRVHGRAGRARGRHALCGRLACARHQMRDELFQQHPQQRRLPLAQRRPQPRRPRSALPPGRPQGLQGSLPDGGGAHCRPSAAIGPRSGRRAPLLAASGQPGDEPADRQAPAWARRIGRRGAGHSRRVRQHGIGGFHHCVPPPPCRPEVG